MFAVGGAAVVNGTGSLREARPGGRRTFCEVSDSVDDFQISRQADSMFLVTKTVVNEGIQCLSLHSARMKFHDDDGHRSSPEGEALNGVLASGHR
jgi:hypothetical protein